ncbi:MAG: hypothetical protein IKN83_01600 [Bacteroidaceae bacterium]|nr:hypothetical protein [Bacteroidaceae bacterium]
MKTKVFFSRLSITLHAFGRLLRKAFNHKDKANDVGYKFTFNSSYINCAKAFH